MTRCGRVASLAVAAMAASACTSRPSATPRARGEVATLLITQERGAAAVVADASYVFVVTWHGVVRASHTGEGAAVLYAAPLGGVAPTLIAADAARVFVVEEAPCEGDDAYAGGAAHHPQCARILAVPKDGGPPWVVASLPPGPPPRGLAVYAQHVYFAHKRSVLRIPWRGGGVEIFALAEDDVGDVGLSLGRIYWVEADPQAIPPQGKLVTRDDVGIRRVVGAADPASGPLGFFDRWVYWIGAEKVWRADVRSGAVESLGEARARVGEVHLAVDLAGVAWTEEDEARIALRTGDGAVTRVPLTGEKPTSIALAGPFAFVVTIHDEDGATRLLRVTR